MYNSIGEDLYNRRNIHLIFDGVDTMAEVKVNNVVVGKMQNMFRQYVFDIKKLVTVKQKLSLANICLILYLFQNVTNNIEVTFQPPVEAAAQEFSAKNHEIPPKCPPDTYKGDCHVNVLRKMQASFGSSLGPSVPSIGFW